MKKINPPSDINNSFEYFFSLDNGIINFAKDIKDLPLKDRKLSPMITQIFDVYGFRIPYPFTIFEGIYRMDSRNKCDIFYEGENIFLKDKINVKPIDNDWQLDEYFRLLRNSFSGEREYAAIMLSSGWDSSSILATLSELMPRDKIKTFTLQMNVGLEDPLNKFEIYKANKLAAHYGVENIIVHQNYHENNFEIYSQSSIKKMLFSIVSCNHEKLWEAISEYGLEPDKTTVYAGEYSDGIHNFGFAQSFGAVYPDKGFRQYGDKINNYFLSPSFLKRLIKEENINDDLLVKNIAGKELINYFGWSEKDLIFDLIEKSFMFDSRGPFETVGFSNSDVKSKSVDLYRKVISKYIEFESIDQFYSIYLRTYQHFHWGGSTVKGIDLHNPGGYKVNMPFGNEEFRYYLEKMPTKYGRGLELLPTKYPLKEYCKNSLNNYPFEIQEGNHAYLYDVDQSISIIKSIYQNSSYPELFKYSWNKDKYGIRKEFLNQKTFEETNSYVNYEDKFNISESSVNIALSTYMIDKFLDYVEYQK